MNLAGAAAATSAFGSPMRQGYSNPNADMGDTGDQGRQGQSAGEAPREERSKGFCAWLFRDPCKHIPVFVYLAVAAFLLVAFIGYYSGTTAMAPYAMGAGFFAVLMATYYYYSIGSLRDQIENMEDQNEFFEQQNNRLHEQLETLQGELVAFKDLRGQFKRWGLSNYKSMVAVARNFVTLFNSLADVTKKHDQILLDQERMLLLKLANDIEFSDNTEGMNRQQFDSFVRRIPDRLRHHWAQLRNRQFNQLCGANGKVSGATMNATIEALIQLYQRHRAAQNKSLQHMSVESVIKEEEEAWEPRKPNGKGGGSRGYSPAPYGDSPPRQMRGRRTRAYNDRSSEYSVRPQGASPGPIGPPSYGGSVPMGPPRRGGRI